MATTPPTALPLRFQLSRMISGIWVPQALYAAAKLGIADALAVGPASADAVAREAKTHPRATYRLLRALATLDVVRESDGGVFELTPLGRCLTADSPDSVQAWALLWGGPMMWEPWGHLADCVRTGEMAPKFLSGVDGAFELMKAYPEDAAHFNRSMLELTRGVAALLPAAYDFSGARVVVDVGGGFGSLLPPLLRKNPSLRGVVYDLPGCAEGSRKLMAEEGLTDRCDFEPGDFFESVPTGGDIYLLKSVIHDWDDAKSRTILERCRAALAPGARLLVLEWIMPDRAGPADVGIAGTDLNMMVMVGGQERTGPEYRALLASAGLRVTRVIPTGAMSVMEAVPA